MGLYIQNMEMPKEGQMLIIFPDGTAYVCFNGMRERLAQAEAVSVPPHGRLIDAGKMRESIRRQAGLLKLMGGELSDIAETLEKGFLQEIANAPTVIPAEEGET